MILVLLSGLDGTGMLFEPFLKVSPIKFDDVFIYSSNNENNQNLTYQANQLANSLSNKFQQNPIVIIAESNGGLLAYHLLKFNLAIKHIFFVACFLTLPNPQARLLKFVKVSHLNLLIKYLPDFLLKFLLFYHYGNDKLLLLFKKAINELSQHGDIAFINRCQILANLPRHLEQYQNFNIPCTYIKAKQDFLIFHQIDNFAKVFTNFNYYNINGSHFLLQTNPMEVWGIIQDALID